MTIQPDQAAFLLTFLLPQLKSEQAVTHRVFSAVPPEQAGYRPDPVSRSALEIARHIAYTEMWFLDAVIYRRFDGLDAPGGPFQTCQEVAEWYAENFARRILLVEALSDADLAAQVNYLDLREEPAVAYINFAIRHSVHHRGQLCAYLRAMGAKVPAIYVESADEPYPPTDETMEPKQPPAF